MKIEQVAMIYLVCNLKINVSLNLNFSKWIGLNKCKIIVSKIYI